MLTPLIYSRNLWFIKESKIFTGQDDFFSTQNSLMKESCETIHSGWSIWLTKILGSLLCLKRSVTRCSAIVIFNLWCSCHFPVISDDCKLLCVNAHMSLLGRGMNCLCFCEMRAGDVINVINKVLLFLSADQNYNVFDPVYDCSQLYNSQSSAAVLHPLRFWEPCIRYW